MISHRLGTIRDVDKVIVMQNGNIAESGTPSQLIEEQGIYWNLLQCNRDDDNQDTESSGDSTPISTPEESSSSSELGVTLKGRISADVPRIVPKGQPYRTLPILRRCFQLSRP